MCVLCSALEWIHSMQPCSTRSWSPPPDPTRRLAEAPSLRGLCTWCCLPRDDERTLLYSRVGAHLGAPQPLGTKASAKDPPVRRLLTQEQTCGPFPVSRAEGRLRGPTLRTRMGDVHRAGVGGPNLDAERWSSAHQGEEMGVDFPVSHPSWWQSPAPWTLSQARFSQSHTWHLRKRGML